MSNLPISNSAPSNALSPAQPGNAADEGASSGQPFGDILARQIAQPESSAGQAAVDAAAAGAEQALLAQLASATTGEASTGVTDPSAPVAAAEPAGVIPSEMLAALLPQIAPRNELAPADPAVSTAKSDALAGLNPALPGKPGLGAAANAELASTGTGNTGPALANQGGPSFAEMLATSKSVAAAVESTAKSLSPAAELTAAAADAPQTAPSPIAVPSNSTTAMPIQAPAQATVQTPVAHPAWGDEFGQKITWLVTQKEQTAELHLNPPQLGPVDVVIKVNGDQASAMFTSPHAAVREAIEQALPKLRDMMADNGIMLGNASVNAQSQGNGQNGFAEHRQGAQSGGRSGASTGLIHESSGAARVSTIGRHNGIVDTFA